jgi:hypothetical protein
VTIDFGSQADGPDPYVEDGFSFDPANLVNGNCPGGGSCLLQNNGPFASTTMMAEGGGAFDLLGFSYQFTSNQPPNGNGNGAGNAVLTVSDTNTRQFFQADYGNEPFTISFTEGEFLGVSAITFSYDGPGSGRLDDVVAESGDTAVIPLPASLPLLFGGLAALGYLGRRRRHAA